MTTQLKVDKENIVNIWDNFKKNIAPKFNESDRKDILMYKTNAREVINILKNQPNNFNDKDPEYLAKFIQLCNGSGYLNNWSIALKITGASPNKKSKHEIGLKDSINEKTIELAKRSGPRSDDDVRKFIKDSLFKASSKSANIVSANTDMAILLSPSEKKNAEEAFYKFKSFEIKKKNKALSQEEALAEARTKTVPERYYRGMMKETEGLLMVYLFDSEYAFNQEFTNKKDLEKNKELKAKFSTYIEENDIDIDIPLVGYAIEFPPIEKDPGVTYLQGDYDLEEACESCGEVKCICNDNEDELEGISDYNE